MAKKSKKRTKGVGLLKGRRSGVGLLRAPKGKAPSGGDGSG